MAEKYGQKDPFWGVVIFLVLTAAVFIFLILQGIIK
jgi:hypothetical protein